MHLTSESFQNGARIPAEYAFGVPGDGVPMRLGANRNPSLGWSDAPAATRSFALICVDTDVPSVFTDVNQTGRSIAHTTCHVRTSSTG